MNAPVTIFLCVVAVLASAWAIVAGTNTAIVVPATAVAVGAAALLLVSVVASTRWPPGRPVTGAPADPARVRSSFEAGVWGRPALVALLDNLERAAGTANFSNTSVEELDRLQALPPEEFRKYLVARVKDLEGRT